MPGASSGLPMNSMPAASKAACSFINVATVVCGVTSDASILLTVFEAIPARTANASALQFSALRAALIWTPVIIDRIDFVHYLDIYGNKFSSK